MLENIFLNVLNMSYTGGIITVLILLLRLVLKGAPRKYVYFLWGIPLIRLLVPFSFESIFSLIRFNTEPIPLNIGKMPKPRIATGIEVLNSTVNQMLPVAKPIASVNPMQVVLWIAALVWISVILILIVYSIVSYLKLKRCLSPAQAIEKGVYVSNVIDTPFVMGMFRPTIYLPVTLTDEQKHHVIMHERAHIKRLDHMFRRFAYFTLCLHWFNPLVWLAFYYSGKDMEVACDEKVITTYGDVVKPAYSQTLLDLTVKDYRLLKTPLAFGEGDTKERIKHILNFNKPQKIIMVFALIIIFAATIGLVTNPISGGADSNLLDAWYQVKAISYDDLRYSFTYHIDTAPSFYITGDSQFYMRLANESNWRYMGNVYEVAMSKEQILKQFEFKDELDKKSEQQLDKIDSVYRIDAMISGQYTFLIIVTTDGKIMMTQGFDHSTRWLYDIEKTRVAHKAPLGLYQHRTPYAGNNSAVINIANQLQYPYLLTYNGFALQTDQPPYGLTIRFIDNVNQDVFPTTLDDNTRRLFKINACIMFSLIQNLEQITFLFEGERANYQPLVYTRTWAETAVGANLWQASQSVASFNELLQLIKKKITLVESVLQQAIDQALNAQYKKYYQMGATTFFSSINLAKETVQSQDIVKVYLIAAHRTMQNTPQGLYTVNGSSNPCILTFRQSAEAQYTLKDFWIPRDGENYSSDINTNFPVETLATIYDAGITSDSLHSPVISKRLKSLMWILKYKHRI